MPMKEEYAREIIDWSYPDPYAFYNLKNDPEDLREFQNKKKWYDKYFVCVNNEQKLVGFFAFEYNVLNCNLEIGLGLSPEYMGKQMGTQFIQDGLKFAETLFNYKTISLKVWKQNQRAIRCYKRLGFIIITEFDQKTNDGIYKFIEMKKDRNPHKV
jgi:ribosomal-protein-alanine N-acetyltransferase